MQKRKSKKSKKIIKTRFRSPPAQLRDQVQLASQDTGPDIFFGTRGGGGGLLSWVPGGGFGPSEDFF